MMDVGWKRYIPYYMMLTERKRFVQALKDKGWKEVDLKEMHTHFDTYQKNRWVHHFRNILAFVLMVPLALPIIVVRWTLCRFEDLLQYLYQKIEGEGWSSTPLRRFVRDREKELGIGE